MPEDNNISIGMFVSHSELGIGRIVSIEDESGPVLIDFHSDPKHLMDFDEAIKSLRQVPENGLSACLFDNRKEVLEWIEEAPLRLVATALEDMGRVATSTELREKLTSGVIEPSAWNRWWRRVQAGLKESRRPISYSPSRKRLRLTGKPDEVQAVRLSELSASTQKSRSRTVRSTPTRSIPRLAEWVIWIHGDVEDDVPKLAPPDGFRQILQKLPESLIQSATERLLGGIEQRIFASNRPASGTSQAWLDSLSDVLNRWIDTNTELDSGVLTRVTTLLTHTLDTLDEGEHESLLRWLIDYTARDECNAKNVANALLSQSRELPHKTGVERLLQNMSEALDASAVVHLWRLMFEADSNLASNFSAWRSLKPAEKAEVISSLLTSAQNEDSIQAIGDLLKIEWGVSGVHESRRGLSQTRIRERQHLFKAVLLAWMLHEQLRPYARAILVEEATHSSNDSASDVSLVTDWKNMAQKLAQHEVEVIRSDMYRRIDEFEVEIKEARVELDEKRKQVIFLQGELRNSSNRSALSISRNAITVLGGALQGLVTSQAPLSTELKDLEAKIILTLSTLGAEPFGEVGHIVPFEPGLHEAHPAPASGTLVRIISPGIRYFRGVESPLTIIRIQVT